MSIQIVDNLKEVCQTPGSNDYSCLSVISNKYGVYIFRSKSDGKVLYIGEAQKQDLKTRVKQNFTKSDTGGTFRKNYMEIENVEFEKFINFIKDCHIICITSEKLMTIRTLESLLIFTLKPKYNKEV